jgi:heptosyltransferase I
MGEPLNILIVKMSAIGDVIHTLPALNALRRQFPNAQITWLVEEAAADMIHGHPSLDRVILSKRKLWIQQLFSPRYNQALKSILSFIKELRDTEYDMVLDFQGLLKSGIMVMLTRSKQKIGFDKGMAHAESSHLFYNVRIPSVSMEIHALKRGLLLLENLGIPTGKVTYNLAVSPKQRQALDLLLARAGIDQNDPIICINPQATWQTKLWHNQKFADLADRLTHRYKAQIVFTGGRDDHDEVAAILSMMNEKATNLAGLTSLKTLTALFQRAFLLVTTDTGPMHLGAAVGMKVLAIFGATAPWRTGPYGSNSMVVRAGIDCSPCFKRHCPRSMACMEQISVERVMEGIATLVEEQA